MPVVLIFILTLCMSPLQIFGTQNILEIISSKNIDNEIDYPFDELKIIEAYTDYKSEHPSKNQFSESLREEVLNELNTIREDLEDDRHSSAILGLKNLTSKVVVSQKLIISNFFPDKILDFKTKKNSFSDTNFNEELDSFGVLFSKTYTNILGETINIHVIFSDPSIDEYATIANNPKILNTLNTITLIKTNGLYPSLEKYSESEQFYERNIIVNEELLINIIGQEIKSKEKIDEFCRQLLIVELEEYLAL